MKLFVTEDVKRARLNTFWRCWNTEATIKSKFNRFYDSGVCLPQKDWYMFEKSEVPGVSMPSPSAMKTSHLLCKVDRIPWLWKGWRPPRTSRSFISKHKKLTNNERNSSDVWRYWVYHNEKSLCYVQLYILIA